MQHSAIAVSIAMMAVLTGCNNAKSPEAVADAAATAQQKSDSEVAAAQKAALQDNAKMMSKVDEKTADLGATEAQGTYDVASKKAEGIRDVAVEKCKVFGGDAQKKCKDQANADYDTAMANAKTMQSLKAP